MKQRTFIILLMACFAQAFTYGQEEKTVILLPEKDNTIYKMGDEDLSNGAGMHIFAGKAGNGGTQRALLKFAIPDSIPSTAIVTSVKLNLTRSNVAANGDGKSISLHRLLDDWGEGASDAIAGEGGGAEAEDGDATWIYRFFNTSVWNNQGGDFVSQASATWTSASTPPQWGTNELMEADVKGWINEPNSNFGWILIGDEEGSRTSNRFDSREADNPLFRPRLTITYMDDVSSVIDHSAADCNSFTISPNPARELVTFTNSDQNTFTESIKIYDHSGKLIRTLHNSQGNHQTQWNLNAFDGGTAPAGIYYVLLANNECRTVERLVVQ